MRQRRSCHESAVLLRSVIRGPCRNDIAPRCARGSFSNIFFFGDSFTDAGNATGLAAGAGLGNPMPPPYSAGRFSDDGGWSEPFAERMGVAFGPAWLGPGTHYAVGRARYGITNMTVPCFLLPNPLSACGTSIFVDQRHPTSMVARLIADAAYDRVVLDQDLALIPERATVLLTGASLALDGLASRRRRLRSATVSRTVHGGGR